MFVQHIFRSVTYLLLLNKFVILLSVSLYVRNLVFLSFCNEKVSFIVFHMACPVTLSVTASDCLIDEPYYYTILCTSQSAIEVDTLFIYIPSYHIIKYVCSTYFQA